MDHDATRPDFPTLLDEESDSDYDEKNDSTFTSSSIVTTPDEKRGVRVFRIVVKTSDFLPLPWVNQKFLSAG